MTSDVEYGSAAGGGRDYGSAAGGDRDYGSAAGGDRDYGSAAGGVVTTAPSLEEGVTTALPPDVRRRLAPPSRLDKSTGLRPAGAEPSAFLLYAPAARSTASHPAAKPERVRVFAGTMLLCVLAAALLATWLPLQISILTVFLFAGPHNWFEVRYFLLRLPARFGRSRTFFVTAFAGLGFLTISYVSLPLLYRSVSWSSETWLVVLATWNTLLLAWLVALVRLRGQQKRTTDWSWTIPVALAIAALNWLGPEFFSLALVYVHPLVALWFLDRQLKRTRPEWLSAYRRCLCLLPLILGLMIWRLSQTTSLADDNGLFWRITQHSGAELLPQVSSHLLVSVHLFLEMLHYGVWIVALPLLGPRFWQFKGTPKAFRRTTVLAIGIVIVVILWVGFATDYATTRDLYFTIAIAHVLAEAPFLLKML